MGEAGLVLDLMLAALLGVTLLHVLRLHRALQALRQDRAALDQVAQAFDSGVGAAQATLRQAADQLAGPLAGATALRDDLAFLSERGEGLADRLDALVRAARALQPAAVPAPPEPVRSRAERELLLALKGRR